MDNFIEFRNVSFRYSDEHPWALDNVSFAISKGEWVAIIGHNGSGKSTIAKLINGLLFPQKGEIIVDGILVNDERIWDVRRRVGMVFQNPDNQFVGTTVRDDVAFGLENRGVPRAQMITRISDSLNAVGMSKYLLHEPHRLSGGQKQRVAIASVMAIHPQILILDEATAMLDPIGKKEIMSTINELKKENALSLVTITHDLTEITQVDHVIVMDKGKVWLEAHPREIFGRKDELQLIGLDVPFIAKVASELDALGTPITRQPLTHEELLEEIWISHSKM